MANRGMRAVSRSSLGTDMTTGAMLPKILMFAIPLILSGMLQLLYNAADTIVVGRFAGAQALAAVGSTGSLINLLTNLFIGISAGSSVVIAQNVGAGDPHAVHKSVHTAITLALISGFAVMLIGVPLSRPLLEMMGSPDDVIDLAALYIRIYFLGMPFNMLYNFGASILRAVGDTKRPLYYLSISGVINILLNLLLVIVIPMSVAGVAIATVVSQVVSSVLVIVCLLRTETDVHLDPKKLCLDRQQAGKILRIGLPAGIQSSLFSISNVLIQSSINSFQSVAMAGNAAASNLQGFAYIAMNAIHHADLTVCGQNYGAREYRRARRVIWECLLVVTVVGLGLGGLLMYFGTPLLSLYNTDPQVIRYGLMRMEVILPTYFLCGTMDVMVGHMRALGYAIMPMLVSLTGSCLLRIVWIMTIFQTNHTLTMLYISYPVSWLLTFAAHLICYLAVVGKRLPLTEQKDGAA